MSDPHRTPAHPGPRSADLSTPPAHPDPGSSAASSTPDRPGFVDDYRRLASGIARGVAVLTCLRAGRPHAITVDSYLDVSWDPPTMAVSVYTGSRMMESLDLVDACALSVLSADQKGTAQWLGEPGQPLHGLLDSTPTHPSPGGLPVIAGALAYFELRITERLEIATHTLLVGEVRACGTAGARGTGRPLVRFGDSYGTVVGRDAPGQTTP